MKRASWLPGLALLFGLSTGCGLLASVGLDRAVAMAATYPETGGSEVSVTYTVPDPPPGNVYVLWILNPAEGKSAKVGVVRPGTNRIVKTRVSFEALGAVVSIESSPDVEKMNNVWALRVGSVNADETAEQTPVPIGGDVAPRRSP